MRKSAWAATSLLLLLGLLAFAATLLPAFACPTCTGFPHEPIGCPDCRDRGRVTFLGRSRCRPLDPRLLGLLTTPADLRTWVSGASLRQQVLESLLAQAGAPPDGCKGPAPCAGAARFVRDGEEHVVLVLGTEGRASRAWVFDRQGTLLDCLRVSGAPPSAVAGLGVVTDPDPFAVGKDVVLELGVIDETGQRDTDISRIMTPATDLSGVRLWHQGSGEVPPGRWIRGGRAFFKVAGGRFVCAPSRHRRPGGASNLQESGIPFAREAGII